MKRHICDTFIRRYTPVLHSLCQKLGILKMGPKHHPSMSDTDRDITPPFCIIVYYFTIMQVYIYFIKCIILKKKIGI